MARFRKVRIPKRQIPPRLKPLDERLTSMMARTGHRVERWLLGTIFIWFGLLKVFGQLSASSIIAKSVYWFDPVFMIPILGWWEITIGITLIAKGWERFCIFLLFIRLPGTLLALLYHYNECFDPGFWTPTIQGQYLLKDMTLAGAALVIGGTIRDEETG